MKHFKKINQLLRSLAMLLCIVLLLPILPVLPGSAEDPSLAAEGSAEGEVTVVCEDESKRTAFEKHYLLSDGTYYAVSYAEAVHEQDEQGKWVDTHSAPVYDEDEDAYLVKGKGYRASFGLSQNKAALINKKGQALCWHYELIGYEDEKAVMKLEKKNAKAQGGKNPSLKGKKVGDKDTFALPEAQGELLFEDAFSALGAEVRYTVSPQKIKEDVILNEKGRVYALSMVIENCDYKARLVENAVILEDSKGNDYFYVDAPLMYDAAGESSTAVQVLLKQTGKTVTVTYTPDKAWLDAPERVYPVTFDPAVTTEDYAANMEDYCTATAGSGPVECTTGNYIGKSSNTIYTSYLRINTLPETGTLPLINASLHVPIKVHSSGLAGAELTLSTIDLDDDFSALLSNLNHATNPVDTDIMLGDLFSDFNIMNQALLDAFYNKESICYQLKFTSDIAAGERMCIYSVDDTANHPVAAFYYGYQNPSFVGEQILLNDHYTSNSDRQSLKMDGSTLSMADYSTGDARTTMILTEGANGGVYIYANYEMRFLSSPLSAGNSFHVANDAVEGSVMTEISEADEVDKLEFIFTPLANGEYMIQLLSNPRLVLTRTANGLKLYNISSINTEQSWIITNIGDEIKTDGTVLKSGIYYINNLSSRTFMVLNTSTATTPILKAGTEEALGDKMAWNIRAIGSGYYMIESVLRPGYYLTCSSSGVDLEFLSTYLDTVPDHAKFIVSKTTNGYVFKSSTNHYLKKSSLATVTIDSVTSVTGDLGKWRVCPQEQYQEFSPTLTDSVIWVKPQSNVAIPYETTPTAKTWSALSDFSITNENANAVSISQASTVTGTAQGGISTITMKHLPSNQSLSFTVNVGTLANGTYYFRNNYSKYLLQPDNNGNSHMEQHSFSRTDQIWTITLLSDGYYKIISKDGLALSVQESYVTTAYKELIQEAFDSSESRHKWKITQTASGGYIVQAASAIENNLNLVMAVENGSTEVASIAQLSYVNNSVYNDEWKIISEDMFGWNSGAHRVSVWETNPTIYIQNNSADSNFRVMEAFDYAIAQWENALSIDIQLAQSENDADIVCIVDTVTNIENFLKAYTDDDKIGADRGKTVLRSSERFGTFTLDNYSVDIDWLDNTYMGIVYDPDYSNFDELRQVVTHELGHALGYNGHSMLSANVMYASVTGTYELTSTDINHLKFFYELCL